MAVRAKKRASGEVLYAFPGIADFEQVTKQSRYLLNGTNTFLPMNYRATIRGSKAT